MRFSSSAIIVQSGSDPAANGPPQPYLDRKPPELSGGQQQRVAIARAMIKTGHRLPKGRRVTVNDLVTTESIYELLGGLR